MAAQITEIERKARFTIMKVFGEWLKKHDRSQRWGALKLGIYHGYVSNLVTGKQMASMEVCATAARLMETSPPQPAGKPKQKPKSSKKQKKVAVRRKAPISASDIAWMPKDAPVAPPAKIIDLKRVKKPVLSILDTPIAELQITRRATIVQTIITRRPSPLEIEAAAKITKAWLANMASEDVTPEDVVEVTRGLIHEFTRR